MSQPQSPADILKSLNLYTIEASLVDRINFASHQNDIAVIADLVVKNLSNETLENLEISIECEPPLLAPKRWKIDRLSPKSETRIRDRSVPFSGALLSKLSERLNAEVKLKLQSRDSILFEETRRLVGLARNEWGGSSSMPDLLAAFVMPNDPAIARILHAAGEVLRTAGHQPIINGYQSKDRKRVWELISAIWTSISALRLVYVEPPASFETEGQKIRTPGDILSTRLATCLDTALLFASAIEQAGLNPIVAFTKGHAFCGAWLQPQQLAALTTDDCSELRKFVALKELVLFETTLVINEPPIQFSKAVNEANRQISEDHEGNFIYALDIKRARSRQISPLPTSLENTTLNSNKIATSNAILALEEAPSLPSFDLGLDAGGLPDTPETRLDHWKRKLLDLTKRNRLLNLKGSRTAIQLKCFNPARLEDKLADGKKIAVIPLARLSGEKDKRDGELFINRTGDDFVKRFCEEALENDEIVSDLTQKDLDAGLVELYRKAKLDQEEGGANTLFLAIGILRWKLSDRDTQSYRAPLILLPVKLDRPSASSKVKITQHDDDPTFNMTLLEMLRQDFDLRIPQLEGKLPEDKHGIDISLIWETVRRAIREVPGFELVEEVVLSTFSFSKFLMWKDLADRTEALKQSSFVRHMIEKPREAYKGSASVLEPGDLDEKIDPAKLFMPLSADSSQVVAIHASTQGGDMVLEGPPGTGKSQTIANIIAHNLAHGKKVLFISEKMAALDVVYRRLKERGLESFCLELHSNKANKRYVLDQLGRSYGAKGRMTAANWEGEVAKLVRLRRELNGLVSALHTPGHSGISARKAIGRAAKWQDLHRYRLNWDGGFEADPAKDADGYAKLEETARKLAQSFAELNENDHKIFANIQSTSWSNEWQSRIVESARKISLAIDQVENSAKIFADVLGLKPLPVEHTRMSGLSQIASSIPIIATNNLGFAFRDDYLDVFSALDTSITKTKKALELETQLSCSVVLTSLEVAPMEQWKETHEKNLSTHFPLGSLRSWFLQKRIKKQLNLSTLSLDKDLSLLKRIKDELLAAKKSATLIPESLNWQGLETNLDEQTNLLTHARNLREGIAKISSGIEEFDINRAVIKKLCLESRDLLQAGMPVSLAAMNFAKTMLEFDATLLEFETLAETNKIAIGDLIAFRETAQAILAKQPRINAWCKWKADCRDAESQGLDSLKNALEIQLVSPESAVENFKTAYSIWIAARLIDAKEELRSFSSMSHQKKIERFRKLDQNLSDLAVQYIRAKLSGQIAATEETSQGKEFSILARELQKKTRHKPVRQLVAEMSNVLTTLTPCVLMSPLSVAQFLPADQQTFDLVVFDEASQITVWDAIGAIARGKNAIIVGDPKQMPPTSFFDRSASEDEQDESNVDDLESILDEALAAGVLRHRLTGHYRSKHESLIAFSNHNYYNGELVTFPCAQTKQSAVSFKNVSGSYERGSGRVNPVEAKAVAEEVVKRLTDEKISGLSLGVVTLNSEQQRLINNLLDDERRKNPDLERFFSDDVPEPVFVKNLETVQGDERDVIILSVGYGPTSAGANTMSMNFGPLNRNGGERRLNVAITRAKHEVLVFSSFDPSIIDLTRTSARAVRDLKHYMMFAQQGPSALGAAISSASLDLYDSDFEYAIADLLRKKGWTIHTQIGVSKFRIDLAVVHPDYPGQYLAGIECDGATYHSSPSARDRDRVRHAILEGLGWKLLRIWSTEFWVDRERTLEKLEEGLQKLYSNERRSSLTPSSINASV